MKKRKIIKVDCNYFYFDDSDELYFVIEQEEKCSLNLAISPVAEPYKCLIKDVDDIEIIKIKRGFYDKVYYFKVTIGGKKRMDDSEGNIIVPAAYDEISFISDDEGFVIDEGFNVVKDGKNFYYFDGEQYPSKKLYELINRLDEIDDFKEHLVMKFFDREISVNIGLVTNIGQFSSVLKTLQLQPNELVKVEEFVERIISTGMYGENDSYNFYENFYELFRKYSFKINLKNLQNFFVEKFDKIVVLDYLEDMYSFFYDIRNEEFLIANYSAIMDFLEYEIL